MRPIRSTKRRPAEKTLSPPSLDLRRLGLVAVAALLVATPLIPAESVAESGAGLLLNLFWLMLFLAWAGSGAARGRLSVRCDWALLAAIAFVALVAVSGWITAASGNPRITINSVWQWVTFVVGFFLMRQWIATEIEQRAICAAIIGLAVGLAALGLYQYFVTNPEMREQFRNDPEAAYREAGIGTDPSPQMIKLLRDRVESVEPIATFALTNSLAGFLAPWLVLTAGLAVSLWQDRTRHGTLALAGVMLALVLTAGCLFLTKSRTAWLATAAGMVLLGLSSWRAGQRINWWFAAIGAAGAVLLFLGAVIAGGVDVQVFSEAPKSLLYRLEYWQATASMIRDYPWWGVGVGNFQDYYTAYKLPQASETIADPHNFILEIAATAGMFALIAFSTIFAAAAFPLRRPQEDGADPKESPAAKSTSNASPDVTTVYGVYLGALLGLLFAYPLGLVGGFRIDANLLWVGAPLAAICVGFLHPWTERGRLPAKLPVIASAVMLINFLAAGGIGFASVATSLWLLIALALAANRRPTIVIGFGRTYSILFALGAFALGVTFYVLAYRPALAANAAIRLAEEALEQGEYRTAEQNYIRAAQEDSRAPEPWRQLASLYAQDWIASGADSSLQAFERAWPEAVRRNQRSYGLWKLIGDFYFDGYRRHEKRKFLDASIQAYQQAVALYPVKGPLRAELAWRLHLDGNNLEAAGQAEVALALDRQNPHAEQKLAEFPAPEGAGADNLEHLAEKLRKLERSDGGIPPSQSSPHSSIQWTDP
jgi:tetratricopeptide (TPR) repeat protein